MSKNNAISGHILDGEKPVATVKHGEVFADATGEKVGFIREGLCAASKVSASSRLTILVPAKLFPKKYRSYSKL
jgi:hypothetical protein